MSKLFYGDIGHEPRLEPPEDIKRVIKATCDCCGEPIFEGDDYFQLMDCTICEACVSDARRCG